jgi:Peptidase family M28
MASRKRRNPLAFTPGPVTFFCIVVYLAIAIPLLVVQLTVPKAPAQPPYSGVNLTEAWQDLQFLTDGFHPYNSRRNDEIHDWLLNRLAEILIDNAATVVASNDHEQSWSSPTANVTIFNDQISNLSATSRTLDMPGIGTYFESTNIIVYIRGSEDESGSWWEKRRLDGPSGTLVNAHYDSVSTGFGATDDGMGVISLMQLVKHFITENHQPRHGIVALFNNGEEDFLNGARAFARHPVSRFPTAFLNLEGAGAGGRAAIFRSTDTQVTRAYRGTEHPCGTVLISDGFKRGLVRSETDYVVFNGDMDMRGIDVAFVEPRARYHTTQDDARHASVNSLWHMLSAALHTMHGLSSNTWEKGAGSDGVWFDLFGDSFVDIELHTLFAISVTLLVVGPVAIIIIGSALSGSDKLYIFKLSHYFSGQRVRLRGFHGFFRTPFIVGIPSVIVIGLALLLVKVCTGN